MKPPLLFKIFGGGILYKISHKEILMRKMQGQDLLAGPLTVGSTVLDLLRAPFKGPVQGISGLLQDLEVDLKYHATWSGPERAP